MVNFATKIEAILYLKGQPLTIAELVELTQGDRSTVQDGIIELMDNYAHRETALEIVETAEGYTLQLKATYSDIMEVIIPPEIGVGALRTLAVIALKKGISQTELIDLRGSGAYQHVQELVQLGYVKKRRQAESRSYWLQVTDKFHQNFQLGQLPQNVSLNLSLDAVKEPELDQIDQLSLDLQPENLQPDEETGQLPMTEIGLASDVNMTEKTEKPSNNLKSGKWKRKNQTLVKK
jgi:segregation and condensation protein B